jgi:hypothetical protein
MLHPPLRLSLVALDSGWKLDANDTSTCDWKRRQSQAEPRAFWVHEGRFALHPAWSFGAVSETPNAGGCGL